MKTTSVKTGKRKAQFQEAFTEWKVAHPKEPQTRTAFLKTMSEYAKTERSSGGASGGVVSLTEALDFLAINQEIIVEPSAKFHM
jgi:hypothetical protein